jgi:hypothetical protein
MLNKIKISFAFLLLCLPFLAQAHGGHGTFEGSSLSHFMTSPLHIIPVVAFLAIGAFYLYRKTIVK